MQIIEVTDFAVRSAVIRLQRRGTPMRFVLYPMLHMAQASFYAEVVRRLKGADVIVAEGVRRGAGGKGNLLVKALTMSYRVLRFNRSAQLVEQDIAYSVFGVPVVNPDVSADEFQSSWRKLALKYRLMLWFALPVVVIGRLFGGTRAIWSMAAEQYDLPMVEEEPVGPGEVDFDEVFGGERDDRLLSALAELHEQRAGEPVEIAVVYGAWHVPAVVRGMMDRYGYRPRSAEWITVAAL